MTLWVHCSCRFNHKTAAEDVHFTSVYSNSDFDTDEERADLSSPGSEVEPPKERSKGKGKAEEKINEESLGGSPSDWEGSDDVLEMILVKDVTKDAEVSSYKHLV